MAPNTCMTLLCVAIALLATVNAFQPGQLVFQRMYDLQGNRDVAYSGKVYSGVSDALVIAGVSTTPPGPGSTGLDFFALMVDTNNGDRKTSFGTNGFVKIDFGNINGTSRTDVATEVVFLTQPHRIAVLGESVVSKTGATNLSFAIAMIDSNGAPVTSFGTNGLALYDVDSGANDEIFFGDVDEQNNLLVGGFANPTPTTGAGPAFNCAVLKVNQFGVRDVNWGQNGQVIIDFNGWDERCRAGLPMKNAVGQTEYYMIGGRSKPAPGFNTTLVNGSLPNPPVLNTPTHDQNNFRATMTNVVYRDGTFNPLFGAGDYDFGFGRKVINANNGSFETIKMIQASRGFSAVMDNDGIHQTMHAADGDVISLGNWGGWDNGISGNKAIGLMKWNADGERLDRRWGNGGISSINPARFGGQSYDVYSLRPYRQHIYVVGGVKATAASASPPRSIVARFWAYNGKPDLTFGVNGVYLAPQLAESTSSLYKSLDIVNHAAHIVGEVGVAPATSADVNVLYARYNLHQW